MADVQRKRAAFGVALVGAETLLGRELQEVLESRGAGIAITSYASSGEGSFGEQEGEAVYVEPLDARAIRDDRALLIAGSAEGAMKAYDLAKSADKHPLLIDCMGHLEKLTEAHVVAPLVEDPKIGANWLLVVAHPAASALALVLKRLGRRRKILRSVAHIFEPASERGKRGVSELHQQTTSLLSFKALDKEIFDAQVSFNLLSQYGEDAPQQLGEIEERIERHLASILKRQANGSEIPMPSLRLVQAPVFHGYSISVWIEFAEDTNSVELEEALASAQIEVRGLKDTAPDVIGAASQSGLIAGDIRMDRSNPRAVWVWVVGDNLRLMADAAADLIRAGAERQ